MNIYIMSRGRAGKVNTLKWIPEAWLSKTFVICSRGEYVDYRSANRNDVGVIEAPVWVTNYSQKFQWILDGFPATAEDETFAVNVTYGEVNPKALIMDDDLVFSSRQQNDKLISIKDPEKLRDMFEQTEIYLDEYALVGIHPRQMGQNAKFPKVDNGRIICMQGVNRARIGSVKVDQFPILADVILNCTLLSRGQPNAILTTFFQDHGPCQAPGGCSIYRTADMQRAAVSYLAARWPEFVKVVKRKTNDGWLANEEGERVDYTAQWKKLYAAGRAYADGLRGSPDREVSP